MSDQQRSNFNYYDTVRSNIIKLGFSDFIYLYILLILVF